MKRREARKAVNAGGFHPSFLHRMTRTWYACGLTILMAPAAFAQPAAPAAFEVASIRAVPREGRGGGNPFASPAKTTPGSLTMSSVTLKTAIAWAYHVFEYQVSGPDWIGQDRYDILAKAGSPAAEPELRAMAQTLLAERFHLELHRQTKEMAAYLLVLGKGGPKFRESPTEGESEVEPDQRRLAMAVRRVSVSQLIDPLSRLFQAPVIDLTGLSARYDMTLDLMKYMPQSGEKIDPLSLIQTGLQEELGLRLESKKYAVDLLMVDRAEKTPVEN